MANVATASLTYVDLMNTDHLPFSSVSASSEEGMNALMQFTTRGSRTGGELPTQIGRTAIVKAEDPTYTAELEARMMGLTVGQSNQVIEALLPHVYTTETQWKWKMTKFVPKFLTPNPAFAVNETGETIESSESAFSDRYGLHYYADKETFLTPAGQTRFRQWMMYWAVSWADTAAARAWAELGQPRRETSRTYMDNVSNQYAFSQAVTKRRDDAFAIYKNNNPYPFVQEYCQFIENRCRRPVNLVVMPTDKYALFATGTKMASNEKLGERGVDMILSRGEVKPLVPGLNVAGTPVFDVDPSRSGVTPLDREIVVGDWFTTNYSRNVGRRIQVPRDDPNAAPVEFVVPEGENGLDAYECYQQIYVDITDQMVQLPSLVDSIPFDARFVRTAPNVDEYTLRNPPAGWEPAPNDPFYMILRNEVVSRELNARLDEDTPINPDMPSKTATGWADWMLDPANNVRFLVVSPLKSYRTKAALFAAGGANMGFTAITKPLLTTGVSAADARIVWSFTCWIGPVILDHSGYVFAPDVFLDGIRGGSNAKFIDYELAQKFVNETQWEGGGDIDRPSLYFMSIGKGEIDANFIDLRGKHVFANREPFPCAKYYACPELYGFSTIDEGVDEAVTQGIAPINWRRPHAKWENPQIGYKKVPGNHHFGEYEGVGCREMRELGRMVPKHVSMETTRKRD